MKYLFIIALSFFIASPVFGAKSVEGTIPKLRPLQPPPEEEYFNASQNIQFRGAPESFEGQDNIITTPLENNGEAGKNKPVVKRSSLWFWQKNAETGDTDSGLVKNLVFIIFLVVVLGGGVYYFKRGK